LTPYVITGPKAESKYKGRANGTGLSDGELVE